MNRLSLFFLVGLAAHSTSTAQVERPIPYPVTEPFRWEAAVEAGTRTDLGVPGPEYWTNRAAYQILAELDPEAATVKGRVTITYLNRSPRELRRLSIHLRQNAHKEGNLRNRYLEVTGGVTVSSVTVDGAPATEGRRGRGRGAQAAGASYTTRGTVMTITPEEAIPAGGEVVVAMNWQYRVPKRGAPRNGHDDFHIYYLGYWYPQFAVYEDVVGWVAEQYFTNAEFYMGYADYDVHFTAPAGWLVRATGTLQNPDEVLTETARKRLVEARTGREIVQVITAEECLQGLVTRKDRGDKLTWHYKASNVRDCAVSVSDQYVWDATHAVIADRDGPGADGVAMIHAVYSSQSQRFGRAAEYARHTIEYMSRTVHPYPWPHMTVCGGVIGGGMEFPMMTICGTGSQGLVAHELIHMWFPMLVGSNEKAHAWQDEGFTSFFTGLTSSAFRGREHNPAGSVRGYLRTAARGEVDPLMTHGDYYSGGGRGGYGFASYSKSAAVLSQLRDLVGDEVFFATFRKYAADWAYKHPRPQDFFNAFNAGAGRDLDWFFRTYYFETWVLDQAIDSVEATDDGTSVVVTDRRYATYPTIVVVTYKGGKTEQQAIDIAHWLSGAKTKTLQFGPDVIKVELNPGKLTLDVSARNNVWERQ